MTWNTTCGLIISLSAAREPCKELSILSAILWRGKQLFSFFGTLGSFVYCKMLTALSCWHGENSTAKPVRRTAFSVVCTERRFRAANWPAKKYCLLAALPWGRWLAYCYATSKPGNTLDRNLVGWKTKRLETMLAYLPRDSLPSQHVTGTPNWQGSCLLIFKIHNSLSTVLFECQGARNNATRSLRIQEAHRIVNALLAGGLQGVRCPVKLLCYLTINNVIWLIGRPSVSKLCQNLSVLPRSPLPSARCWHGKLTRSNVICLIRRLRCSKQWHDFVDLNRSRILSARFYHGHKSATLPGFASQEAKLLPRNTIDCNLLFGTPSSSKEWQEEDLKQTSCEVRFQENNTEIASLTCLASILNA
jgi:hypothetical protein